MSRHIAVAVADVAYKYGLVSSPRPNNLMAFIESQMYDPQYWREPEAVNVARLIKLTHANDLLEFKRAA